MCSFHSLATLSPPPCVCMILYVHVRSSYVNSQFDVVVISSYDVKSFITTNGLAQASWSLFQALRTCLKSFHAMSIFQTISAQLASSEASWLAIACDCEIM